MAYLEETPSSHIRRDTEQSYSSLVDGKECFFVLLQNLVSFVVKLLCYIMIVIRRTATRLCRFGKIFYQVQCSWCAFKIIHSHLGFAGIPRLRNDDFGSAAAYGRCLSTGSRRDSLKPFSRKHRHGEPERSSGDYSRYRPFFDAVMNQKITIKESGDARKFFAAALDYDVIDLLSRLQTVHISYVATFACDLYSRL